MWAMLVLSMDPVLWAAPTAPTPHPFLQSNQDPFPDKHSLGLPSSHCFRSPGLLELRLEWCIEVPSYPQHPGFSGQSLRTSWPGSLCLPEPDHLEGLSEVCQEDTINGFHSLSLGTKTPKGSLWALGLQGWRLGDEALPLGIESYTGGCKDKPDVLESCPMALSGHRPRYGHSHHRAIQCILQCPVLWSMVFCFLKFCQTWITFSGLWDPQSTMLHKMIMLVMTIIIFFTFLLILLHEAVYIF